MGWNDLSIPKLKRSSYHAGSTREMIFNSLRARESGNGFVVIWILRNKLHDDVIKWKHFPRHWSFVRGIHRSLVNSPHKGQWRGALVFSLICARINGWINNGEAGDLRRHRVHYDVIVMLEWNIKYVQKLFHENVNENVKRRQLCSELRVWVKLSVSK